jgi:hypothetical protein
MMQFFFITGCIETRARAQSPVRPAREQSYSEKCLPRPFPSPTSTVEVNRRLSGRQAGRRKVGYCRKKLGAAGAFKPAACEKAIS